MMRKLLIAVPSFDTMRVEFVRSLMALTDKLHADGIWHEVKILNGSLVHIARDRLAKHAVNNEFTEVLWLDADMVFDGNVYEDLAIDGKDMICGSFISRHYPYVGCLFKSLDPVERITKQPEDTIRVAGCGFGCVLMKAQVLKDVLEHTGGQCFIPDPKLGEDLAFCKRATACGYEIWCEPAVQVGHVGSITIWPGDEERLRGDIQNMEGKTLE